MSHRDSNQLITDPQETIHLLQKELAESNSGLVALTLELEQRVEERTAQLREAHNELRKTNTELMQLTLELEDRVTRRMEEIQKLNQELEARVRERTAELEASNKELEAFSYSVSHDLRAPLRAIDGFSLALLEDYEQQLDDRGKDHLRRVRGASQRMGQLIDDMLDLSRVTRREMRREKVDLSALARSVGEELRQREPHRQVDLHVAGGAVVIGDPHLFHIALENLLGNAWKFTGKKERARIEFGVAEDGGSPRFFVRDDGVGFDMRYVDKLFGAFQRLHAQGEFEGTGVGLATVQRIIHRHGGRVWAEGAVEKGATFYFTL